MATEITTNINSVLVQGGKRSYVNFVQSTFNPAFYQFGLISGTLFIGDTVYIQYLTTEVSGVVIDMTAGNITINNIPYNVYFPPTFSALATFPPTAQDNNFDVRVVAAFNPVVIEMQRQDYKDNTQQSDWNGTYVSFPCGTVVMGEWVISPGFEVGAVIQVISESGTATNYTILNIASSGGILYATFDRVWSVFNPFFLAIVNIVSRLNFYVTLRITNNALVPVYRDLRFTPNASGMMRCEISGALRSFLNLNFTENEIDPNAIRTEETNLYTPFYFATKDNWIGSSESWIEYYGPEDVKFAIAGAFQIGDPNNGYYNKYFANTDGSAFFPEYMPQWITQFENPVHFVNFPYTLSFLGNALLLLPEDFEIRYKITKANGTFYNGVVSGFLFTDLICLEKLNIFEALADAYTAGVMNDAKSILFRIGRVVDTIYFFDALAPITINVKRPVEQSCNTFYVRWINTLGGWDYWLFEGKIYEGLKVENGNNYESYFDTISSISDFENVTFKNVTPAVQVGSNTLTRNEAEGLKILTTSPKIYWYNEELSKWIGVIVEPGTFNIRSTKEDYFNVELTFVKPRFFNQFA